MTAAHWQKVKTILADALEYTSEEHRGAFLLAIAREDSELKAQLDALVAVSDAAWCDEPFLLSLRPLLLSAFTPAAQLTEASTISPGGKFANS